MLRRRLRLALPVLAIAMALTACGGASSGAPDQGNQADEPVPSDAPADTPATTGAVDAPAVPAEAPDPCSLLTEDEAFALLTTQTREEYAAQYGSSDLAPTLNPAGDSGEPTCEWGNAAVQLAVSIIEAGDDPDLLRSFHDQMLENWTGDPVEGVGDGAEIGGSTPVDLQAFDGYWLIDLRAYVSDTESTPRFARAAGQVFARLAGG